MMMTRRFLIAAAAAVFLAAVLLSAGAAGAGADLSQPDAADEEILRIAEAAAVEIMSFDYDSYQRQLQKASRHFTRDGWSKFSQGMENARLLQTIATQRGRMTAAVAGESKVTGRGTAGESGVHIWEVVVPLTLTLRREPAAALLEEQPPHRQALNIALVIARQMPTAQNGHVAHAIADWAQMVPE